MTEREADHLAFGPNGREVAALIDRAGRLTPREAKRLGAVWDRAFDAAAWGAAWRAGSWAAWRPATEAGRSNAAWVAARAAACEAVRIARLVAGDAVWGAAQDAALAVAVRDLITEDQFDVLYRPWARVIEKAPRRRRSFAFPIGR